jgi:hypothetical protein
MYPEVEQYLAAVKAAEDKYEEAAKQAPRHDYDMSEDDCARCAFLNPIRAARDVATEAAMGQLAQASDPLVRWIAENCQSYPSAARTVLEALPASMAELNDLAADEGWCGTWEDFVRKAEYAGVLPSADAEVSA